MRQNRPGTGQHLSRPVLFVGQSNHKLLLIDWIILPVTMMFMKKIIIIGAGMGGLTAGINGQINGFQTEIFEHHAVAGGQACSWKRKGYTFDGCLHHFMGAGSYSKLYTQWKEVGVNPDIFIPLQECVSVWKNGRQFFDWYDLEKLEQHMLELSPEDEKPIKKYIQKTKQIGKFDMAGEMTIAGIKGFFSHPFKFMQMIGNMGISLDKFSQTFKDPLFQDGFKLIEYSLATIPFGLHIAKKSDGANGGIKWPPGGISHVVDCMVNKYKKVGGKLNLGKKVVKILVENGKAVGVQLEDGSKHMADYVISNADGRKTLTQLLENKFTNEKLKGYLKPIGGDTNWAFHVYLGVNRDLSKEPNSLHVILDKSVEIAGHTCKHLELQMFGFDKSMAPAGKGVIKVELFSTWDYCENLGKDKEAYEAEKKKIADKVIEILDGTYFKGLKEHIEVVDVPTLLTWSRYLNSEYGFQLNPNKKLDIMSSLMGKSDTETVEGLANFRMCGTWATSTGALFANVNSGKKAIRAICKQEHIKFKNPPA